MSDHKMRSHILIILAAWIATASALCHADPEDFPPGSYELELGARPGAPYPPLQNYNIDLSAQGSGPDYSVEVSRHHIIPYNVLRAFYNRVMETHGEILRFRSFLIVFGRNIPSYASAASLDCERNRLDYLEASNLALAVADNYARWGGNRPPPGLDTFQEFYTWLPGNLFIGPNNRSDDPGEGFEEGAVEIVGQNAFNTLSSVYQNMVRYNNGDQSVLGSIATGLTQIADRRSVYPLYSGDWQYVNGEYRIKTPQGKRTNTHPTSIPASATTSDTCNSIIPDFEKIKAKYAFPVISPTNLLWDRK
ncbi:MULTISPECIES: hypothetical protein [Burkholderia]|uniref:hypothetical protein n=1 Tax=Burkholderia TaxID=32008 RepID=UPI0011AEDECF|nr:MULTISPECIES: hypothetical protein [unclassified Burkholderia]